MPSLQDRRDYRLEGAWHVSQMSYEEKIVGEEKRLFGRAGLNRLCISGLMHEAWCSSVDEATISQSLFGGRERVYWLVAAAILTCACITILVIATKEGR